MMTEIDNNDNEFSLLRLVPTVLRARDFRLYASGGQRLTDLWQNGGAAILGHTPPLMLRELKNYASRGLYAPHPHFLEARYHKVLSRIFPGRNFRLYAAPPDAVKVLVADGTAVLWRPFTDSAAPLAVAENARDPRGGPSVLIPVVPGIQGWRGNLPLGLCVTAAAPDCEEAVSLPLGEFLPPVLLACAARGLYDLIAAAPERAKPAYPRITKVLKNSRWLRQGLYLTLRETPSHGEWAALFNRFLEGGFLLPPVPSQPAILPGILSPGEEAKLAALL
jgi:hypothetical protein